MIHGRRGKETIKDASICRFSIVTEDNDGLVFLA